MGRPKDVPHRIANVGDGGAGATKLLAQIGQEAGANVADKGRGAEQLVADQRDVLGKGRAQYILHDAEGRVHAVDNVARIVEDAQQAEIAEEGTELVDEAREPPVTARPDHREGVAEGLRLTRVDHRLDPGCQRRRRGPALPVE